MQICLMIEGQENVTWDQWLALALACEEHGFDALFRSDHYLSFGNPTEYGSLDAWATLAALSQQTRRIRLGTMVSPVTFRHPSQLAKAVVTADHASGGRIELGMGAGWFEGEHSAYGFPFPPSGERMGMLGEQIEIVHRLWDKEEDEVTFHGEHYRLERCHALPKPLQDPHPTLIMGGGARSRSAGLAARWADEYNLNFVDPRACREGRERLFEAFDAIGRDPAELRMSLMTSTVVAEDRAELEDRVGRLMARTGRSGDPRSFIDSTRNERIMGTVDQVLERLAAYAEAGVQRVMMQHLLHDDLEMLGLIGQSIIPEAASL